MCGRYTGADIDRRCKAELRGEPGPAELERLSWAVPSLGQRAVCPS